MSATGTTITMDAADAIELAEALGWLRDWFASDPELAHSMRRYSFELIPLDEIDTDLRRFIYLLGGET